MSATGNTMCIGPLFSFIPSYGLKSRVYDIKNNAECTDLLLLHKKLRADGRHNYAGLQIPISSKLTYTRWAHYLVDYWDCQLPLLVKFGFLLDFDRNNVITSQKINHKRRD